jgi:hypothetical protein
VEISIICSSSSRRAIRVEVGDRLILAEIGFEEGRWYSGPESDRRGLGLG